MGIFIISLDFELHWGVFDKKIFWKEKTFTAISLKIIPSMMKMFESYNVRASWATVVSSVCR